MSDYRPNSVNLTLVVRQRVRKVASEVLADAIRLAPFDTGNLMRSIRMREVGAVAGGVAYVVGTNVTYAPFQEFGTYKMPAHPFLGPALETARRKYG